MKITITTSGKELNVPLTPRFGNASGPFAYDRGNARFEVTGKQNLNTVLSAGMQATERVVRLGAKALTTGHCGSPKAFRVLQVAGGDIYNAKTATEAEAIALYSEGRCNRALIENVSRSPRTATAGHAGCRASEDNQRPAGFAGQVEGAA